jgi:hypothetical protein
MEIKQKKLLHLLTSGTLAIANVACPATLAIANVAWLGTLAYGFNNFFFLQYHISFH